MLLAVFLSFLNFKPLISIELFLIEFSNFGFISSSSFILTPLLLLAFRLVWPLIAVDLACFKSFSANLFKEELGFFDLAIFFKEFAFGLAFDCATGWLSACLEAVFSWGEIDEVDMTELGRKLLFVDADGMATSKFSLFFCMRLVGVGE